MALGIIAIFLATHLNKYRGEHIPLVIRNFFGVHRLEYEKDFKNKTSFVTLIHGTTRHGRQKIDPQTLLPINPRKPLTYYTLTGPLGGIFEQFIGENPSKTVAIVGLGTGTIAAYANKNQGFTFFEIDPAMKIIAENTKYFTYLSEAKKRGAKIKIIMGDARISLTKQDNKFDLIIIDAFTSDSIPLHLLTEEALQEAYLPFLNQKGAIVFHISNRYFELGDKLSTLAFHNKLICLRQIENILNEDEIAMGKSTSDWVLLTKNKDITKEVLFQLKWKRLISSASKKPWTDQMANILSVIRW